MKKHQLIIWISCIALLSISTTILFYSFYKIEYIKEIPMDVTIGDTVGINIDSDALHFGTIPGRGCSKRSILIQHKYEHPSQVIIIVVGELQSWTSVEDSYFTLDKGEETEVGFRVCVPSGAVKGKKYTSTARIIFKRL